MLLFALMLLASLLLLVRGRAVSGRIALALTAALFPFVAFGADPVAAATAATTTMNSWTAHLNAWTLPPLIGAILVEVARWAPTQKPISLAWTVVKILTIVIGALEALLGLLRAVATKADSILGQVTKPK